MRIPSKPKRMRIVNNTKLPTSFIRDAVRFVKPPGIKAFTVTVNKRKSGRWSGGGNGRGVVINVQMDAKYPCVLRTYQYGQLKQKWTKPDPKTGAMRQLKGRRYWIESLPEAIIYLLAHELMHTKQGQRGDIRRGRPHGARGRYSEIETESYAIRKLREFRRIKI